MLSVVIGDDSGSRMYWNIVDPVLSCRPENAAANLERIHEIYDEVNRNGITQTEIEQARNKVASRVVLRSERPMGRLSSLGGNWVYRQEYRSVEDDLKLLRSISTDDVRELLQTYPLAQTTTVSVGPLKSLNGEG